MGLTLAGTFVAFGPENFKSTNARTATTYTRTFTVLNPHTTYVIRLNNGGLNGQFPKASSATVTIN
ncbi:MAG TPA: hypothetical protein VFT43_08195, partial [Candidatus Polarisedimenticolia bacterium]|nr:hypothetical protein [Candidatus Polarisedimenticolia bacterium]